MGEALGSHEPLFASPQEPSTPKHPPKRPRPETPKKDALPSSTPKNWQLLSQSDQDTSPASPIHESPQSQLGLELQSHISIAATSRMAQIKNMGDEVLELVSLISQEIANWEERSLQEVAFLGKDIRTLVLNFSKDLATRHPAKEVYCHQSSSLTYNSYAAAARTPPNVFRAHLTSPKTLYKSSQSEKPPCIFLHLLKAHPVCQASLYVTMDILRKHLDKACSTVMKEVQQMFSGLAIWLRDGLGLHLLLGHREALESLIQSVKVEIEQNWVIFALSDTPQQYTSYDEAQVPISEQMVLEEFKLQTGLSFLKFNQSNKNPHSSTLIIAVPEDQA